jgi:N-acetylneuraminic acid mutarotase
VAYRFGELKTNSMKKFVTLYSKTITIALVWLLMASGSMAQSWHQRADILLSSGIDAAQSFAIDGKIYFAGGAGSKTIAMYDPATDQWTSKGLVPGVMTYRGFGVSFAIGSFGYLGLGADAGTFMNDLWRYDPGTGGWLQMADFPGVARTTAGCFVVNDKAYVMGGVTGGNVYTNEVWEYDPATDQWNAKSPLSGPGVAFPFTFTIGSKGYLMGGEVNQMESVALVEYDPATDQWSPRAPFPGTARQAGVSFVMNGMAYCGLGMSQYTTMYGDMFSYDAANDQWASAGNFTGGGRAWATAMSIGNKAYVGTGWDFNTFFKDWWEYSNATGVEQLHSEAGIKCFPNPAVDMIQIDLGKTNNSGSFNYSLFNIMGQQVQSGDLPADGKIALRDLSPGSYSIHIRGKEEAFHSVITIKGK